MIGQYGEEQFTKGFEIIKSYRNVLYEDGESKLAEMLKDLDFESEESLKGFINFCTTYLIVQNMQCWKLIIDFRLKSKKATFSNR